MNTDTHVDIDTLEVSPEEDLLTETNDFDEDEDLEVEISGEEEDKPEDTNPAENQPESKPTEDPAPQPEAETFTLKYKGQEGKYTREQLLELASKGLDYDGLRADRDRLRDHHPALEILDRYAAQNGMTRDEYMEFARKKADEAEVAPQVKQLMDSGVPEAAARELALRRLQETRGNQLRQQQQAEETAKQNRAQQAEAQKQADYKALIDYAKETGADLQKLPQEVLTNIAQKGMKPLEAYLQYENAQLRLKNSQLEQNQKNQQKNPGRITDNKPNKVKDPFDEVFDQEFGL